MNRFVVTIALLVLGCAAVVSAEPLSLMCPPNQTIPCDQLDNLDRVGRAEVVGGCGDASLMFRDSVLAMDSLVIRIWIAEDTCGGSAVGFQSFTMISSTPRLAVLPLENLSSTEEGGRVLQRLLEGTLGNSTGHVVISPAKVDDAISRGRVRQPVLMDDDQRQKLSKALDAQFFLVGSLLNYEVYQDQYSGPIPMISCALQLQRAYDGKTIWSESLHAVGNDGEWLFALGVEHDITRLGRELARKASEAIANRLSDQPCNSTR